jgi:hypothetical protein
MLELVKIDALRGELDAYKTEVKQVLEYTKTLEIKSAKSASNAIDYIAGVKDLIEAITAKKMELTQEARDYTAKINNLAKSFLEPLSLVKDMILQKIDHWKLEEARLEAEASQTAQEYGVEVLPNFIDNSHLGAEKASSYERESYSYTVADESLVPREYLMLDDKKIKAVIKAGVRNISGLAITKSTKTIVKRF